MNLNEPAKRIFATFENPKWEFAPFGDFYILTIRIYKRPCLLRRIMQRIFFGSKYRKIN